MTSLTKKLQLIRLWKGIETRETAWMGRRTTTIQARIYWGKNLKAWPFWILERGGPKIIICIWKARNLWSYRRSRKRKERTFLKIFKKLEKRIIPISYSSKKLLIFLPNSTKRRMISLFWISLHQMRKETPSTISRWTEEGEFKSSRSSRPRREKKMEGAMIWGGEPTRPAKSIEMWGFRTKRGKFVSLLWTGWDKGHFTTSNFLSSTCREKIWLISFNKNWWNLELQSTLWTPRDP